MRTLQNTLLAGFIFLGSIFSAQAMYTLWDADNGVPIRQAAHADWMPGGMASDEDGSVLVAWSDARGGSVQIYAQLYGADGSPAWDEDLQLSGDTRSERRPVVIYLGDAEWAVGWYAYFCGLGSCGVSEILLQKIDSQGTILWEENGINLVEELAIETDMRLFPSADGGVFITWRNDFRVRAQRISDAGNREWGDSGVLINDSWNHGYATTVNTSQNSLALAISYDVDSRQQVFIQQYDWNGEPVWNGEYGVPVSYDEDEQYEPEIISDGDSGFIVAWHSDLTGYRGIYGQRFDNGGDFHWDETGCLLAFREDVAYQDMDLITTDNNIILGAKWRDEESTDWLIQLQRMTVDDLEPMLHWEGDGNEWAGISLTVHGVNSLEIRLLDDGENGVIAGWSGSMENGTTTLGFQHVDQDGEILFNTPVIHSPTTFYNPLQQDIRISGDNLAVVTFDQKPGNGALHLDWYNSTTGQPSDVEPDTLVSGIYGNAFDARLYRSGEAIFAAWLDRRDLLDGVIPYVSRIDPETGMSTWGRELRLINGIRVDDEGDSLFMEAESLQVAIDGQGGGFAVWSAVSTNYFTRTLFAQRFDEDGSLLWGEDGVAVTTADPDDYFHEFVNPRAVATEDGGVLVFYLRYGDDWSLELYGQKLDEDGQPALENPNGVLISSTRNDHLIQDVVSLSDHSYLLLYNINFGAGNSTLYVQRYDQNLNPLWDAPVTLSEHTWSNPSAKALDFGNTVIVTWRGNGVDDMRLFAQRMTPDGELLFDAPEALTDINVNQFRIVPHGLSFWASWEEAEDDYGIAAMRYNLLARPMLTSINDVEIGAGHDVVDSPRLFSDQGGGVYIFYGVPGDYQYEETWFTHLNGEGELALPEYGDTGVLLTPNWPSTHSLSGIPDGEGGVISVWTDFRSSTVRELSDIYAQRINDRTVGADHEPVSLTPEQYRLDPAYPNPFNPSTTLRYSVPSVSELRLTVSDILGRTVRTLVDGSVSAGQYRVTWDGRSDAGSVVASGIYFVQMRTPAQTLTQKLVLVK